MEWLMIFSGYKNKKSPDLNDQETSYKCLEQQCELPLRLFALNRMNRNV
jgi:hypothetical protein